MGVIMNDCQNCAALQTEVNRLRLENKRLAERIKKLIFILEQIRKACEGIESHADGIMSRHQPRGVWSFAKGTRAVARAIATLTYRLAG